jgi:MIP family channel proteins
MPNNLGKALVAEFIGTFALIFLGVLAISSVGIVGAPAGLANLASIGLAHGLAIGLMVAALGGISGGHFNPAVTFAFVVTGRLKPGTGLAYWAAQLAGATVAALIIVALFKAGPVAGATPNLGAGVSPVAGTIMEAIGTFFLVLVVFGTAVNPNAPKNIYPLAIGLTIAIDIMAFGPITGAAVNPARAFGPALASGEWSFQYVYWIGPLLGGAAAGLLQHHLFIEKAEPEKE